MDNPEEPPKLKDNQKVVTCFACWQNSFISEKLTTLSQKVSNTVEAMPESYYTDTLYKSVKQCILDLSFLVLRIV